MMISIREVNSMAGNFNVYCLSRINRGYGVARSCSCRPFSSITSPLNCLGESFGDSLETVTEADEIDPGRQISANKFSGEIERLKCLRNSRTISTSKVRSIIGKLVNSRRYEKALEIWIKNENRLRMSQADYARKLELIIKVRGLTEAEDYFTRFPNTASQKAACFPLLHGYVKDRDTEKAEAFMVKLRDLGLILNPHLYNEMMKLYLATSQYDKVPLVIQEMKLNQIHRNVVSYNLWMNASAEISGVDSVEKVYKEMQNDKNVQVGWSTMSTLAVVFMRNGLINKAIYALKVAEKKLSTCNRLGYFFLITLYASLNNKDGVMRLWEACKSVPGRITCANYICILLCFVKLGDLRAAEKIFSEWENSCRKYDIRISNVLLGAYVRNGLMEKAESLHIHTLKRGGFPNYKTWEILVEGIIKYRR